MSVSESTLRYPPIGLFIVYSDTSEVEWSTKIYGSNSLAATKVIRNEMIGYKL